MKRLSGFFAVLIAIAFLVSCNANFTALEPSNLSSMALQFKNVSASATGAPTLNPAGGAVTAASLTSMKYRIIRIFLADDISITGSGYNTPSSGKWKMFTIFSLGRDVWGNGEYDSFNADKAASDSTGYVDLMDASSVASLGSSPAIVNSDLVGKFNYVLVDWFKPVKVKGTINLGGTTNLYTHDGTHQKNGDTPSTKSTKSLLASPAEEAVVELNNGGTWFRLLKPLEITAKDVAQKTSFKLFMAFNPEGVLRGANDGQNGNLVDGSGSNSILVPQLDLSAVVYRAGDKVVRETYEGTTYQVVNQTYTIRLEIYTIQSDSQNVYAVTWRNIIDSTGTFPPSENKIFTVTDAGGGSLSFNDYANSALIKNFKRQTAVNATTSATVTGSAASSVTFTLKKTEIVN